MIPVNYLRSILHICEAQAEHSIDLNCEPIKWNFVGVSIFFSFSDLETLAVDLITADTQQWKSKTRT